MPAASSAGTPGGPTGSAASSSGGTGGGTLLVMFNRVDKEKKGYISEKNLRDLMRDEKTYFQGKDSQHIMDKYGTNGKISFEQFKTWWGATYTTYSDDMNIGSLVDEVQSEQHQQEQQAIRAAAQEMATGLPPLDAPHNSNVAVSRS